MQEQKKWLNRCVVAMLGLLFFVVGLKELNEFDLFIFLKTGKFILDYQSLPTIDVFSVLNFGQPWTHIKWGYSLLLYLWYNLFQDQAFIVVLQGVFNLLLFFFMLKSFKVLSRNQTLNFVHVLAFMALIVAVEYRMLTRPEVTSHLMSVLFLYLILRDFKKSDALIFLLIPLQIIWANMHDAFVLGWILSAFYLIAQYLKSPQEIKHLQKPFLLFLLVVISSCFNVLGFESLIYPFNVFNQLNVNQYTPELFTCFDFAYWRQKEPYIFILFFVAHLFFIIKHKYYNVFYLLVLVAFFVLGLKTYRNIVFFILLQMPFLMLFIQKLNIKTSKYNTLFSVVICFVCYVLLTSNVYYKVVRSSDRFGLSKSYLNTPIQAADFIGQHNLSGKLFSDYLSSSYYLFRFTDYKSYIDLRDLDVFTREQFDTYAQMMQSPKKFIEQINYYDFKTIALYTNDHINIHQYLFNDSLWSLSYVDVNTAVYQRKNKVNSLLVNDKVQQENYLVNKLLSFFKKGDNHHAVVNYNLAKFFYQIKAYSKSLSYSQKAVNLELKEAYLVLHCKNMFALAAQTKQSNWYTDIEALISRFEDKQKLTFLTAKAMSISLHLQGKNSKAKTYAKKALSFQEDEQLKNIIHAR